MKRILLNSDVGEEAGFDDEIMPFISWCNVACGTHAGNNEVIKKTIDLALQHDVKIGAHPSYPDRENFGRVIMDIPYNELVSIVTEQIHKVKDITEVAGGQLHHVKPHGALYNEAMKKEKVAKSIIESIKSIDKGLYIVAPKSSLISDISEGNLQVKHEVFADRNYHKNLTLVSRYDKNAVLTDPKKVFDHVWRMVSGGKVKSVKGEEVPVFFDTICVHGDNPKSVQILEYICKEFSKRNYTFK